MSKKLLTIFAMGLVIILVLAIPLNLSALISNGCKAYCGGSYVCGCGDGFSSACVSSTSLGACSCDDGPWEYHYC